MKTVSNFISKPFPLTWKVSKASNTGRKIINQLARKVGEFYTKTVADRLDELNQNNNTGWANIIKNYQKTGTKFDLNDRPKFAWVALSKLLIDEDIQREMDIKHIQSIAREGNFDPRRLAPIFAVKDPCHDIFHCTDGQHTVVVTAGLAQAGLWEGVDPKDWDKVLVPVFFVETDDRSFAREYFAYINGKGKKRIDAYDTHKQEVLSWRLDNNGKNPKNPAYELADKVQTLCETNNCYPLRSCDDDSGLAGAITHVSGMRQQNVDTLRFIVESHNTYWPGEVVDSGEFGFFGNLYESCEAEGIPTKTRSFKKFNDELNAIVKDQFVNIAGLRLASSDTFKAFSNKVYSLTRSVGDDTIELAIVLKIYEKLGGQHQVPAIARLHKQGAYDIIDFLPASIKQQINSLIV